MNVSGLQYNLNRKTLEIYVSGCDGGCKGCHNPDLWDYSIGKDYKQYIKKIDEELKSGLVNEFWVLGGDPMDQNLNELCYLLAHLFSTGRRIWLWTRKPFETIPEEVKQYCTYIKTGEYIENDSGYVDKETGVELASSNQKIHKL